MIAVLLTVHVLIVLGLIGVVLLQRSEGGALGMGGGGGGGGFMTGRGAANALTRTTSVLAALFFSTSMALALVGKRGESEASVIKELTSGSSAPAVETGPTPDASTDDLLKSLGVDDATAPAPAEERAPAPETVTDESPAAEESAPEQQAAPDTGAAAANEAEASSEAPADAAPETPAEEPQN